MIGKSNKDDNLNASMRRVVDTWAIKHSKDDAHLGALLPNYTKDELANTVSGRSMLLSAINKNLSDENIKMISTPHEVLACIKTLDDMGYYYFSDAMVKSRPDVYENIKNMIFPTPEELDMRCSRNEKMMAITYGIGTEINKDLIAQDKNMEGCFSGKAKYHVPPTAKRYIPWFEQLSRGNKSGDSLPLIAGASQSSARLVIMLQHLGAFNKTDGTFDFDKAQIVANCLMAYYVFCGHHSFLEVIEIWNRLLDYVAINHANQLPKNIFPAISNKPDIDPRPVELDLPYAEIGDYYSFFHVTYANEVITRAKTYSKNIEESVVCLGLFGSLAKLEEKKLTISDSKFAKDGMSAKLML